MSLCAKKDRITLIKFFGYSLIEFSISILLLAILSLAWLQQTLVYQQLGQKQVLFLYAQSQANYFVNHQQIFPQQPAFFAKWQQATRQLLPALSIKIFQRQQHYILHLDWGKLSQKDCRVTGLMMPTCIEKNILALASA